MNAPAKVEAATLHSAMALAFAKIEAATKSANNPHFKSKYADLGAVIDAVKPALIEHGLFFTQHPSPSDKGICVETMLHHASGESLSLGTLFVPANKQDAQGFGSAMTYARRYGLQTAFGVPSEDDDGNAASRPTQGEQRPETAPREKLAGPYTSKTGLQTALRAFAETLKNMGDLDEFTAWMETPEVVELSKQAERDAPAWWETGVGMPPEFVPLAIRIADKARELKELESIANSDAAKMVRAG